jgi:hypothetical protein
MSDGPNRLPDSTPIPPPAEALPVTDIPSEVELVGNPRPVQEGAEAPAGLNKKDKKGKRDPEAPEAIPSSFSEKEGKPVVKKLIEIREELRAAQANEQELSLAERVLMSKTGDKILEALLDGTSTNYHRNVAFHVISARLDQAALGARELIMRAPKDNHETLRQIPVVKWFLKEYSANPTVASATAEGQNLLERYSGRINQFAELGDAAAEREIKELLLLQEALGKSVFEGFNDPRSGERPFGLSSLDIKDYETRTGHPFQDAIIDGIGRIIKREYPSAQKLSQLPEGEARSVIYRARLDAGLNFGSALIAENYFTENPAEAKLDRIKYFADKYRERSTPEAAARSANTEQAQAEYTKAKRVYEAAKARHEEIRRPLTEAETKRDAKKKELNLTTAELGAATTHISPGIEVRENGAFTGLEKITPPVQGSEDQSAIESNNATSIATVDKWLEQAREDRGSLFELQKKVAILTAELAELNTAINDIQKNKPLMKRVRDAKITMDTAQEEVYIKEDALVGQTGTPEETAKENDELAKAETAWGVIGTEGSQKLIYEVRFHQGFTGDYSASRLANPQSGEQVFKDSIAHALDMTDPNDRARLDKMITGKAYGKCVALALGHKLTTDQLTGDGSDILTEVLPLLRNASPFELADIYALVIEHGLRAAEKGQPYLKDIDDSFFERLIREPAQATQEPTPAPVI